MHFTVVNLMIVFAVVVNTVITLEKHLQNVWQFSSICVWKNG